MNMTEEQKNLLLIIGNTDDGTGLHVVPNGQRLTQELMRMGLLYRKGKDAGGRDSYDLTAEGKELYKKLSGPGDAGDRSMSSEKH